MIPDSMRMAFIYGPWCLTNRRFNFSDIWDNSQGLTGSELSYLKVARKMADRGHQVRLYTLTERTVDHWEGLTVHDYEERGRHDVDVAISWNESEPLRQMGSNPLKVVSWQLNNLDHCTPDVDDFVDMWMSPSKVHRSRMIESGLEIGSVYGVRGKVYSPDPSKWKVVPHGCEPGRYRISGVEKVPGRVIWASSPDRGLHWILQEWPKIRRSVPYATLKVFYNLEGWIGRFVNPAVPMVGLDMLEQKNRAFYIREAVRRLEKHGVEVVDSVSRNRIDREMAEAEVLAYSCDPVVWTEGFSITLMESCAARACPVTTAVDALPDVYGGTIPMIETPVGDNIGQLSDLVIRALTDQDYRNRINDRVEKFAKSHSWDSIVDIMERLIQSGIASRPAKN